jgi:hypothetical protein
MLPLLPAHVGCRWLLLPLTWRLARAWLQAAPRRRRRPVWRTRPGRPGLLRLQTWWRAASRHPMCGCAGGWLWSQQHTMPLRLVLEHAACSKQACLPGRPHRCAPTNTPPWCPADRHQRPPARPQPALLGARLAAATQGQN